MALAVGEKPRLISDASVRGRSKRRICPCRTVRKCNRSAPSKWRLFSRSTTCEARRLDDLDVMGTDPDLLSECLSTRSEYWTPLDPRLVKPEITALVLRNRLVS